MKTLLFALALMAAAPSPQVKVTFFTPTVVRVQKAPEVSGFHDGSVSVVAQPEDVRVTVKASGTSKVYSSPSLKVTVAADGTVSFATANGKALMKEGESSFTERTEGLDKGAFVTKQAFRLEAGEPLYGLGILQDGQLSLTGKTRYMRQDNTEDFVPFVQSVKGYGIFWDNPSTGTFTDKDDVASFESEVGTQIDYYFIYGGNADGVIAGMRGLTGHVPMIPLWGFGFMQSRERYKSSAEYLGVLRGYRERGVPLDVVIQDWQYWGNNYQWNAMEFLNDDFRNAQAMIDETHDSHAHILISIWASFGPMTKPFRELDAKGHLLHFGTWPQSGLSDWPPRRDYPSGVLPYDAFSSEARDIYWDNLMRLEKMGIDGWWMDSTEPDHLDYKDSDLEQMTAMGSYRSVLNAFPLMSVEGVTEKQLTVSDRRPMVLTRSAYAGQQRTGANTWSGDVQSTWNDFRHQISAGQGFTLTAIPYFNSDIGGFFPSGYNKRGETQTCSRNPLFQELYVRWLQFGVFNPMMRSHGESSRREIWEFGEKGEPVYDAIPRLLIHPLNVGAERNDGAGAGVEGTAVQRSVGRDRLPALERIPSTGPSPRNMTCTSRQEPTGMTGGRERPSRAGRRSRPTLRWTAVPSTPAPAPLSRSALMCSTVMRSLGMTLRSVCTLAPTASSPSMRTSSTDRLTRTVCSAPSISTSRGAP